MQITLNFSNALNCSVSVGDSVYFTPITITGGYKVASTSTMQFLGTVISVSDQYLQPVLVIKKENKQKKVEKESSEEKLDFKEIDLAYYANTKMET